MKKVTLIIAFFCAVSAFGQQQISNHIQQLLSNKMSFRPEAPFEISNFRNVNADSLINNATYASLSTDIVQNIFKNKYETIELTIPYNNNFVIMQLYRVTIAAKGFHIDTNKNNNIPYSPGAYYRGIIKGNPNSVAAFSFFETEMYGVVSAQGLNNLVVGKLKGVGNIKDYIIYSDINMNVKPDFKCNTDEDKIITDNNPEKDILRNIESEHCVTFYFELRYNLFVANMSDTTQTANWLTAVFNNVQSLYGNDGITTALKSVYIWTEQDPYDTSSSSAYDLLTQFANYTPVFDGDAGQLLSNSGGKGLALSIGGLCSSSNISYTNVTTNYEEVPTYSWTINVITHELGHILGSQHTHGCYWNGNNTAIDGCGTYAGYIEGDCPQGPIPGPEEGGTIMSYCHMLGISSINFANGFGPQPTQRILNHIAASLCLGTNCINSCINTVSAINLLDTTTETSTLSWNDEMGGPWEIGYAPYGEPITNWQVTTQNIITIEGLDANSYYTFSIHPLCEDNLVVGEKKLTFSTAADWCSGAVWTDTGGIDGDYLESQRTVTIIKPQNANQSVAVTFESFSTQYNLDIISVYDGIGITAPLIGSWSGYVPPSAPFQATNADGALTFEFTSIPGTMPLSGWAATVECTLGTEDNSFSNISYYPNSVSTYLTIKAPNGISSIKVFNLAGQILAQKEVNSNLEVIDMSAYAAGLYIVNISSNNQKMNLKIVKE